METIILSAGQINYHHLPIPTNTSNSMVPVNGKPAIGWILEDVIKNGGDSCIVVRREEDVKLKKFLMAGFSEKLVIVDAPVAQSKTILHSLFAGINLSFSDQVCIILGDTLVKEPIFAEQDTVFVSSVTDSHRWCIAHLDEGDSITNYSDKVFGVGEPLWAVCGVYVFSDTNLLKSLLAELIKKGGGQLSDLLTAYSTQKKLRAKKTENWLDFGSIDNLIKGKQLLLQSRYFNSLTIDPVLNTITKVSLFDKKLRDELNWYEELPEELKVLTPRVISKETLKGKLHLKQEYYGYPNLAELFLFSELGVDQWESIFRKLFEVHDKLKSYTKELSSTSLQAIYLTKTWERVKDLCKSDNWWEHFLNNNEFVEINGKKTLNLFQLKAFIKIGVVHLIRNTNGAIIHGDYCFSNILFDINSQIVRLIDPRGSFGEVGIYGDPRYDIAKLRHSVCSKYDFITSDLFEITIDGNKVDFQLKFENTDPHILTIFDRMVSRKYHLHEIQFIEGLLFISMLPLHKDKPKRQRAMFVTGIQILNELYENRNRFGWDHMPHPARRSVL